MVPSNPKEGDFFFGGSDASLVRFRALREWGGGRLTSPNLILGCSKWVHRLPHGLGDAIQPSDHV